MSKSDYEVQAEEFARLTGTTMTADYKGHYAREGWDYATAQFRITLKRGDKSYSFDFSESINDSWIHYQDGRQIPKKGLPPLLVQKYWPKDGDPFKAGHYTVKPVKPKPSLYDILTCLQKYDPGSHEDFCADFGYDPDSRKGLKLYLAVQAEWLQVDNLFHDCLEELSEIN